MKDIKGCRYVLRYVNEHGDTIARDYFSDITVAIKFMEQLIATYRYYNENKGLILYDEDSHMVKHCYEPECRDYMKNVEMVGKIKEILREMDGVSDNQEFGLSYSQAINYLEKIRETIKM